MNALHKIPRNSQPARRLLLLCAALMFALTINPSAALAQATPSIVDTLPANTCVWLRVHNLIKWHETFSDSQFRSLMDRPAFRDFLSAWNNHSESDAFALEFGMTLSDFELLADREFVIAWVPLASKQISNAVIIDTSHTGKHVGSLMKKSALRLLQNGYTETPQPSPLNKTMVLRTFVDGEKQTVIGHGHKRFVVAHDADIARDLLTGSTKQLSTDPCYQYVKKQMASLGGSESDGRIEWFAAPWRVLRNSPSPPANLDLMIAQGFGAVDAVGGSFASDADNVLTYQLVAHVKQPLRDAAVSLKATPVTMQIPNWLVNASRSVQVVGVNAEAVLEGYGKWFDATEGEGEEGLFKLVLEEIRDEPDAPGVDIKVELIDQVASPLYAIRPRPIKVSTSMDVNDNLPIVSAVQARQPSVVRSAIGKMLAGDPDVKQIQVAGVRAWQFGDLTDGGRRQVLGPDLSQITVCVYREHVLASSKAESIAALIRHSSQTDANKSTADSPLEFLKILVDILAEDHPNRTLVAYRFGDGADWFARGYHALRNTEVIEQSDATLATFGNVTITMLNQLISGPGQVAFSKLPPGPEAQKHLGIALDVMHSANQDGWVASGVIQPKELGN